MSRELRDREVCRSFGKEANHSEDHPHTCYSHIIDGEKQKSESVENLREWVLQEAKFQTKALIGIWTYKHKTRSVRY